MRPRTAGKPYAQLPITDSLHSGSQEQRALDVLERRLKGAHAVQEESQVALRTAATWKGGERGPRRRDEEER